MCIRDRIIKDDNAALTSYGLLHREDYQPMQTPVQETQELSLIHILIRSYTSLTSVYYFSPEDSFGGQRKIGSFLYNTGAFSPQFQSDGGQSFCRRLHDDFSDPGAASKEDMIKWQC